MNYFKKLRNTRRAATGLEWTLFKCIPWLLAIGTALPLALLLLLRGHEVGHLVRLDTPDPLLFALLGLLLFNWSAILTLAIGCVIVIVMKGPGYVADEYAVSHSDQPGETDADDAPVP